MTVVGIKRNKIHKKVCHKKKLKFEKYPSCSEGTQLENKINHLEKNINIGRYKKIIKNSIN